LSETPVLLRYFGIVTLFGLDMLLKLPGVHDWHRAQQMRRMAS
jgi:hypothetical protein